MVGGGGDWGVYRLIPEHSCTVHCDSSYHELVSGGGEESGTAYIQAIVGADSLGYLEDLDRKFSRKKIGRRQDRKLGRER